MAKLVKKVMLVADYEDGTTFWRIPCDCSDPDHDVHLWFEVDEDGIPALRITRELGFYAESWYSNDPWFERVGHWKDRMVKRFKASMKILFKGYLTMDGEVCLSKEGIEGLQFALTEGTKAMVKAEEAFAAKRKAEAEAKKDA
jgi:hypothetical protein